MPDTIAHAPSCPLDIDAAHPTGPLELWRHSLGHGGINPLPLPPRVVEAVARLRPRLVRIFLQEFFRVLPSKGRLDWSRLEPYMDALAATGAKVVAAICIKPPPLYPTVDHRIWRPSDPAEWQRVVGALAARYGRERGLVTHWEVGNEVDIGESGGSPYLITDPAEYHEYYRLTTDAILRAQPDARVGGPANAGVGNPPMPGFIRLCRQTGTRLDFVSHHLYSDDPARHAAGVRQAREMVAGFPERVETMVTEFSPSFEGTSTQDQAFEPRRAGAVAAAVLAMMEAGLDWSFHYHIWDQVCFPDDFRPFFSDGGVRNMVRHWNEVPHRFGLFGVNGEVRPQYFLYWMLGQMGDERLAAASEHPDLRAVASRRDRDLRVLLANFSTQAPADRYVAVKWAGLAPGPRRLTVYRIDAARRWDPERLELEPVEVRDLWALERGELHVHLPAGCVALACLDEREGSSL